LGIVISNKNGIDSALTPVPSPSPLPPLERGEREKEMGVRAISIVSCLFEMTIIDNWVIG